MRACSVSEQDSHIPLDRRTFLRWLFRWGRGRHESGSPSFSINRFYRFSGLRGRLTSAGKTRLHFFLPNELPGVPFGFLQYDSSERQIGGHVDQCGTSLTSHYVGIELAVYEPMRESLIRGKTL